MLINVDEFELPFFAIAFESLGEAHDSKSDFSNALKPVPPDSI